MVMPTALIRAWENGTCLPDNQQFEKVVENLNIDLAKYPSISTHYPVTLVD